MSYRILHLPPSHYKDEVPLFPVFVFDDTATDAVVHAADIYAKDMKRLQETLLRLKENEHKLFEEDLSDEDDDVEKKKEGEGAKITYDNLIMCIERSLMIRSIDIARARLRLYKNDSMSRPAVAIVLPGETVFTSLRGETPLEILGQAIKHIEQHLEATSSQIKLRDLLAERDALRLQLQKTEECIQRLRDDFSLN